MFTTLFNTFDVERSWTWTLVMICPCHRFKWLCLPHPLFFLVCFNFFCLRISRAWIQICFFPRVKRSCLKSGRCFAWTWGPVCTCPFGNWQLFFNFVILVIYTHNISIVASRQTKLWGRIRDCLDKDMQQRLVMWSPPPEEVGGAKSTSSRQSCQTARFHTATARLS